MLGKIFGQELQRNMTAEIRVLGLVDHTHSTTAESLEDAIVRNYLANYERKTALGEAC
jgi:hypothetical protein